MFQIEIDTSKLRLRLHQFVPFFKSYLFFKMLFFFLFREEILEKKIIRVVKSAHKKDI